jgi:uncharacterized protein (TIGR02246 family)
VAGLIVGEGLAMPVHRPEDMPGAYSEAFNSGQVDALLALYEPDATLVAQPGQVVTGKEQIREAYTQFLALKARINVTPKRVLAGRDVALAWNTWALTGTGPDGQPISLGGDTTEILRRQPDGTWLFAVDDPYSQG